MGFFTDAMTVYNYYRNPVTGEEAWRRTVVKGVQWTHGKRRISVLNGVATESVSESVTIDFGRWYEGNKPYLDPVEYAKLPADEAAGYWTLDAAGGMDVAVCGEVLQEITADYKINALKRDIQHQGTVTSVRDNRNRFRLKNVKVVLA